MNKSNLKLNKQNGYQRFFKHYVIYCLECVWINFFFVLKTAYNQKILGKLLKSWTKHAHSLLIKAVQR